MKRLMKDVTQHFFGWPLALLGALVLLGLAVVAAALGYWFASGFLIFFFIAESWVMLLLYREAEADHRRKHRFIDRVEAGLQRRPNEYDYPDLYPSNGDTATTAITQVPKISGGVEFHNCSKSCPGWKELDDANRD